MVVPGGAYKTVLMQNAETGTADGTAAEAIVAGAGGYTSLTMQVTGVSGETITFEATVDGTNWVAVQVTNLNDGTAATTATANGLYRLTVLALYKVRARISTGGSGTVTVLGLLVA